MILYHFTGLAALIGPYGLEALEASDGPNEVDARDFAAPGSILRVGLKPGQQRRWGLDHDAKEFEPGLLRRYSRTTVSKTSHVQRSSILAKRASPHWTSETPRSGRSLSFSDTRKARFTTCSTKAGCGASS
jgi:hypothetical protein